MSKISVEVEGMPSEIAELAERLGGICSEPQAIATGFEQSFEFQIDSMARQFHLSALLYPQVISVNREAIRKAIAESRLCDCGWTTKFECSSNCRGDRED